MTYEQTMAALGAAEQAEKCALRKRAWFAGVVMLFLLATELVLTLTVSDLLAAAEAQMGVSAWHRVAYYVLYGGYYAGMLLLPAAVVALLFRQKPLLSREGHHAVAPLEGLLLVLFGFGFCVLANYLTNYWLMFMEQFGVEPFLGDYHNDAGWLPLVLNLVIYALMPALVEEFLFRGWLLAALQPCGEGRALLLSALLFGLAHGNLTQLPFALLLGLLFGYVYLRTGRLWIGMVIHFLNNALSVVLDYATLYWAENTVMVAQMAVFAVIVTGGVVAGLLLTAHPAFAAGVRPLADHRCALPSRRRGKLMWGNPAVILTLVVYTVLMLLGEVVR